MAVDEDDLIYLPYGTGACSHDKHAQIGILGELMQGTFAFGR